MKHSSHAPKISSYSVAPYTGAWIETQNMLEAGIHPLVAPYTGAWIETFYISITVVGIVVAPYTGAWIETPDVVR